MVQGNTYSHRIGQTAQATELLPAIASLMAQAGLNLNQLGMIVTTVGPGSFTGVRIGLAALHGLVLANPTPIKTLTTLTAMAWAVARLPQAPVTFWLAIRAGKGEIYAQAFRATNGTPSPCGDITLKPETFNQWDAPCFGNHLPTTDAGFIDGPDARTLCAIAQELPETSLAEALPLYIRPPDAIAPAPHPWLQVN
jgi:N6-L-threonylcarbamoyladenine synthase